MAGAPPRSPEIDTSIFPFLRAATNTRRLPVPAQARNANAFLAPALRFVRGAVADAVTSSIVLNRKSPSQHRFRAPDARHCPISRVSRGGFPDFVAVSESANAAHTPWHALVVLRQFIEFTQLKWRRWHSASAYNCFRSPFWP